MTHRTLTFAGNVVDKSWRRLLERVLKRSVGESYCREVSEGGVEQYWRRAL